MDKSTGIGIGEIIYYNHSDREGYISPYDGSEIVYVIASTMRNSGYRSLEEGQEVIFELHPQHQKGEGGYRLTATRIEVKGWAGLSELRRHYN
ncbi:hypothetical protein Q7P36_004486 [Cladosporium allicinum]